jgi:hypothetical protein
MPLTAVVDVSGLLLQLLLSLPLKLPCHCHCVCVCAFAPRVCLQADGGKGVAAYIVPTEDPHMSEYPPDTFKRREYISGWVTHDD